MGDAARTVAESRSLDKEVHRRSDLLADRADTHVGIRHADHDFKASQRVAGGVGVDGGERSVVTGIHGLQHVQGLLGADLADDDTVGTHTEGVDDELPDMDCSGAFDVGGAGLHARHVGLLEAQFGGVFDGDDPFVFRNVGRECVQEGRLTGAGAAGDQDIEAGFDAAFEQFQHPFGEGQLGDQIFALQRVAAETADGEQRPIDGDGRNGGVDARPVGEAGVHQGRGLVHAAADARYHLFDDAQQVGVVLELHRGAVQFARPFHVDQARGCDQNVAYRGVLEERFQRTQTEDLVQDLLDDAVLFDQAERGFLFLHQLGDGGADLGAHPLARHGGQGFQVDPVQQFPVKSELQLLIFRSVTLAIEQPVHPAAFAGIAVSSTNIQHGRHCRFSFSVIQKVRSVSCPSTCRPLGCPASWPAWRSVYRARSCGSASALRRRFHTTPDNR